MIPLSQKQQLAPPFDEWFILHTMKHDIKDLSFGTKLWIKFSRMASKNSFATFPYKYLVVLFIIIFDGQNKSSKLF